MLKPNAIKTNMREEAKRMVDEFIARGGAYTKLDPAVAQGLKSTKYIKRALKGAVAPLGSRA